MVTETVTETQVDQSEVETQTEVPEVTESQETVVEEHAAETQSQDATTAAPQVEVTEPEKPEYITRADWERQLEIERQRAADDALERDRRRRQTEGARLAKAEKDEREAALETADVIRASLVSQGLDPSILTDEAVTRTIDRVARKRADRMAKGSLDTIEDAWDYVTAPAYGKQIEATDDIVPMAERLAPKVQHLLNTFKPFIEKQAREGYIEADLGKLITTIPTESLSAVKAVMGTSTHAAFDSEIAKRAANGRKGQEELKRVDGTPAHIDTSDDARIDRISAGRATDDDRAWWAKRYGQSNRS